MSTDINIKKKIAVSEESTIITTDVSSIDFVGAGVTASTIGNNVTVTINGAPASVTSVGLSMPSAFSVSNSPIISSGTIAVTGAGIASQYIRGDGTLANFSTSTGGGASVSYYLNGSVSQGTIGGVAYKEMNTTPVIGTGTDFNINADGYIAQFITDAGDPNKLLIPGGNWNFETYFSASSSGGTPRFYIELYKYDGAVFTLISSTSATPENITGGTSIDLYFTALAVPPTVLSITDRLAVRFYVIHSGRTITMHTENSHLSQIITTFSTGLTTLNGLTSQAQYFATGTSGVDFNIASATDIHTFNLPTASNTNRGLLSSADWITFNSKGNGTVTSVAALTLGTTGTDVSSTVATGTTTPVITLNIPTASATNRGALSSANWTTFNNKVGGSGTTNKLSKWTGASTLGDSLFTDNGTRTNIGGSYASDTTLTIVSGLSNLYGVNIFAADDALIGYTIADYGTGVSGYAVVGTGVYGESSGSPSFGFGGTNIGVQGKAFETDLPALTNCIGGRFEAFGGAANYSVQLVDGTQASGKFLKSVTATGQANWANITAADVSGSITGSGTNNYLTKWTPTGTALGNSLIQDDGTTLSIGTTPSATIQFLIQSNKSRGLSVSGLSVGVYGDINFTLANGTYHGLYGDSNLVAGSATRITYGVYGITTGGRGVFGISSSNGYDNVGVEGKASDNGFGAPGLNIGGKFTATGATANYGVQIIDGTEGTGKYLKCVDGSTGYANWAAIPVAFSPMPVSVCDTAPTAASTQYYYQTISEVTGTISKVKMWGFSGTDLVRFGIYRGTLGGSMTLIGQGSLTCSTGPNEISLTAEVGQTLNLVVGENLVVGYYADGTSWRTIYDVGISDVLFGITNTANITTMPTTPTGTATGIRFACTLYS